MKNKHHTKEKGDHGNIEIIADLARKGLKIMVPLSEHLPFDLVAFDSNSGKLYKIQSKYKAMRDGKISVKLRTSYATKNGCVSNRYEIGSFDIMAIYCPELNKVLYCKESDLQRLNNSLTIRVTEPKVGVSGVATTNSRMVKDYLEFPY